MDRNQDCDSSQAEINYARMLKNGDLKEHWQLVPGTGPDFEESETNPRCAVTNQLDYRYWPADTPLPATHVPTPIPAHAPAVSSVAGLTDGPQGAAMLARSGGKPRKGKKGRGRR